MTHSTYQKIHLPLLISLIGAVTLGAFLSVLALPVSTYAQSAVSTKTPITDDQVNTVAQKLYCPVCENIPLDTCGTAACAQWRDEIRNQLEQGRTEQQVIDDFVNRYGDRVVGTPQDPTLRALSLVTPWVISVLALIIAAAIFIRWRAQQLHVLAVVDAGDAAGTGDAGGPTVLDSPADQSVYRAQLERDLAQRR